MIGNYQKLPYKLSRHARQRCAQRNYGDEMLAVILEYGTETAEGILMRKKDVEEALVDLRANLRDLEALKQAA